MELGNVSLSSVHALPVCFHCCLLALNDDFELFLLPAVEEKMSPEKNKDCFDLHWVVVLLLSAF